MAIDRPPSYIHIEGGRSDTAFILRRSPPSITLHDGAEPLYGVERSRSVLQGPPCKSAMTRRGRRRQILSSANAVMKFMLEILAIIIVLIGLAKHPKRRRYNLRRVRVTPELALVTLATDTAIVAGSTGAAVGTYRLVSTIGTWAMVGATGGDGPITVGFAHSDYTVTEIKECLESFISIDRGKKVENERSNRLVRIVGVLDQLQNRLNNGNPIKTRLNWVMQPGDICNIFAYNEGTGSLTTGAVLHYQGSHYIKDSV